ncbi:MAG: 16S rRNA (guanine(527)-N(7))-methyltransferase RsmG [Acidobacteria bacterium RIFCSPLOWO2_12_FULL_67_14]|nr:MAG: 16S rRNA (guanine(527)-N(7))-methyltransferase RsmG [Acidobacteria bacterium RIFCSPLOWO2_02_FULL_67_21]OFW38187.1 MAG: 16S rRNA (guanine(527)-N(7))-methyltransferase RsmG [Acidobacteria bacterium RIFCSPLOWO2_12_FULL_67_14]
MTSREFIDKLTRRARRVGVAIDPDLARRFEAYFRVLAVWNAKINLTGWKLTEFAPDAIDRLLVEPLVAARYVPSSATRMLDIGSGGGSPAIPMALSLPRLRLTMVESKMRKSVFLREAVRVVELDGAEVVTARFEELLTRPDLHEAHDLVTIRAVRLEPRTLMTLQAFVKPGGLLFLFRGSTAADPSETVTPPLAWKATYPLLESARSRLVLVEKHTIGRSVPRGTPNP